MNLTRRNFIKSGLLVSAGILGLKQFINLKIQKSFFYGILKKDKNGLLDLPEGFSYKIISEAGNMMNDGFFTPGAMDGMGSFYGGDGISILIRNHENLPSDFSRSPFGQDNSLYSKIDQEKLYDEGIPGMPCTGGTTTIVYDTKNQKVIQESISLIGTLRNCAGGSTPWGTWITCEEVSVKKGYTLHDQDSDGIKKNHGYNFEIPASKEIKITTPKPLKAMGRFRHEAISVDPKTGIVYQTEDRSEGLIYRFIPEEKQNMNRGKLQALCIKENEINDTRNWEESKTKILKNKAIETYWIDVDDPENPEDKMRFEMHEKGAAIFARSEGMWYGNDEIYFACTEGGPKKLGQIFRYKPGKYEGSEKEQPGKLELFIESTDKEMLQHADNITISPKGHLICCEDAGENSSIVGITQEGEIYKIADLNENTELAGSCFSADGTTLFVNAQWTGKTFAITGPW